ncbi:MAG: prolyl oligopeptidase family serine peptidase [Xanthomonadales bacterium]|nr:prolyl oligopeptidase family serine peptidase [Xanthomonadales bacterium]
MQVFIYKVDGLNIGGFYLAPKKHEGKLPVIVFNRGGTATFSNITFGLTYDLLMPLAKQGFLIIGSQYRGGLGETIPNGGKDEWGGADVRDVVALFSILEKTSRADMDRIGMLGGSRGGMMTLLALQKGVPVKAIALAAPALDLVADLSWRPGMDSVYSKHMPNYDENREEVLAKRSAINWVDELDENVPILLIHGQYDERVNPVSTLRFAMELQKNFHPYKLVILDRDSHSFSRNYQEVIDLYIDWFKDYL